MHGLFFVDQNNFSPFGRITIWCSRSHPFTMDVLMQNLVSEWTTYHWPNAKMCILCSCVSRAGNNSWWFWLTPDSGRKFLSVASELVFSVHFQMTWPKNAMEIVRLLPFGTQLEWGFSVGMRPTVQRVRLYEIIMSQHVSFKAFIDHCSLVRWYTVKFWQKLLLACYENDECLCCLKCMLLLTLRIPFGKLSTITICKLGILYCQRTRVKSDWTWKRRYEATVLQNTNLLASCGRYQAQTHTHRHHNTCWYWMLLCHHCFDEQFRRCLHECWIADSNQNTQDGAHRLDQHDSLDMPNVGK